MKYLKAKDILPKELIEELQKYAGGSIVYIPKPKNQRLKWGELTGGREYIDGRNKSIRAKHGEGHKIERLAEEFCLSVDSIKKIVYA